MAARDEDFLSDGFTGAATDPFTGLAPAEDPSTAEAAARAKVNRWNIATSTQRGDYEREAKQRQLTAEWYDNPDAVIDAYVYGKTDPEGHRVSKELADAARHSKKLNHDAMNTGAYKALTYGILAAPAAITGGAAAGGALGFGEGTGSIAAGNAGLAASESAAASAPAVGYAAQSAPFAMASPYAAAGATAPVAAGAAVPAATAPAAAASPWASAGAWASKTAIKGLGIAAPYLINAAFGGRTKEEKALIAKQEQLAAEAKVRVGQQQDARMNQLGQQLLAFNPSNQLMAQMYGPQAAFTPEQAAQMVQGQAPASDPEVLNYTGTDQKKLQAKRELIRRRNEYAAAEEQRRNMMMSGIQQPGAGPAPIQMSAPQAARKY